MLFEFEAGGALALAVGEEVGVEEPERGEPALLSAELVALDLLLECFPACFRGGMLSSLRLGFYEASRLRWRRRDERKRKTNEK